MNVNPFIFRAYDVRGKVDIDVTPDVFEQVGRAYGTLVRRNGRPAYRARHGQSGHVPGAQGRPSVGACSRPAWTWWTSASITRRCSTSPSRTGSSTAGATVTGSHNPVSDNGVKMVHAGAAPLTEDEIQGLLGTIRAADFERGQGARVTRDPREEYFGAIANVVTLARRLTVVVDAGNGVAGTFAPELLRRLGCEVVELYCESDGTFPNHLPDPEMEENVRDLIAKVQEVHADIGIAYDGDADRMGVVDERGRRHEADLILALLARDLLGRHPGAEIVFDVKSSQVLVDDVRAHGGRPVMWKTGHSHLKRKMREDGILLGGEVSGHLFFGENWYGVDDGILASCKFLELCSRSSRPVSSHFDTLPHLFNTPELKAPCPDDKKFEVVAEIARVFKDRYQTIETDGARILFGEGWGLVRASNTNAYLTLRFEGRTQAAVDEMKRMVYEKLARYPFVTLPG